MDKAGSITREVRPGEFYRHFKNKLYQVVTVAVHSETGERLVVYQALYGDFQVYARPYEMFVSLVDREKYPEAAQTYRFERVEPAGGAAADAVGQGASTAAGAMAGWVAVSAAGGQKPLAAQASPDPAFLRFLEAESHEERMECLKTMEPTVSQRELDSIYLVLDMKPETGSVEEQLRAVERFLTMQNRFDGSRLR